MQALGGEKGAVLPLLVEMLCVSLSGGNPGIEVLVPQEASDRPRGVSHLFVVMDGRAFGGADEVARQTSKIASLVENASAADPAQPPRMPGARGTALRMKARRDGIPVSTALSAALGDALDIALRAADPAVQGEEMAK
jgi:(2R)-3-sulfolactate dehydrogenase (NADP+)